MIGETERLFRTWGRGVVLGLYCGLSLLFAIRTVHPDLDSRLLNYTNIYGLEAAAGAAITFVLIARCRVASSGELRYSPVWICVGLVSWAVGQLWWLKETLLDRSPATYPAWSDVAYLLADLSFVLALLGLFSILRRRLVSELPPWGFVIA